MNVNKTRKTFLKQFKGLPLKLYQYGNANKFEVENEDVRILFSYNTPVAFKNKHTGKVYRTDTLFSPTTYKHIYEWTKTSKNGFAPNKVVPQKEIENAVEQLKAYGKLLAS